MPKLAGINHLNAVRALEKAGFWVVRQGKHIVMTDGNRIITVPVWFHQCGEHPLKTIE